jgi:hypothetical protein
MMQATVIEPSVYAPNPPAENRHQRAESLVLTEIDRASVVDSIQDGEGTGTDGVCAIGGMRERCPSCMVEHLKLVLRQKRVRHAHLYCATCDKCFDAINPDGSSALELDN